MASCLGSAALSRAAEIREAEYLSSPLLCKQCFSAIPYKKKAASTFCSKSCSAKFNNSGRQRSEISRKKTSESVKLVRRGPTLVCAQCQMDFVRTRSRKVFCSAPCNAAFRATNKAALDLARKNGKRNIEAQMAAGKWRGWSGKGEESGPEKVVRGLLLSSSLCDFTAQHQVGRYSLDFAFVSRKIALEVDGEYHDLPAQKEHDKARDDYLVSLGWVVFRIRAVRVRTTKGRSLVESQFKEFLRLFF